MIKLSLIKEYINNNRLKEYEEILSYAKNQNFQIISLRDWILNNYKPNFPFLILRHDVDNFSKATNKMFELEKKYNSKASYYFRHSTFEPELALEIERYGSEASFHYETISDYCISRKIDSIHELIKNNYIEECLDILQNDLEHIRNKYNLPCSTIASHGAVINKALKIANNSLIEDTNIYTRLGIKLEAYNMQFLNSLDDYISDTSISYNDGYRYGKSPLNSMKNGSQRILFLTHPEHWHYSTLFKVKRIIKILLGKEPFYKNDIFKRI